MKLILLNQGGLQISNYQSIVKLTRNSSSANLLYGLKQHIKIDGLQYATSADVNLKRTLFTAVILSIFFLFELIIS